MSHYVSSVRFVEEAEKHRPTAANSFEIEVLHC